MAELKQGSWTFTRRIVGTILEKSHIERIFTLYSTRKLGISMVTRNTYKLLSATERSHHCQYRRAFAHRQLQIAVKQKASYSLGSNRESLGFSFCKSA